MKIIQNKKICVVGCGGLGGYIIEMSARLGIGSIVMVDKDIFDETNLNRQLLSSENVLGKSKVDVAVDRVNNINSNVLCIPHNIEIDKTNIEDIIDDCDIVIDAVDNIKTKLLLEETCDRLKLPLIHGAIGGWYGQISTIMPGDNTLKKIYKDNQAGIEKELGNPSFTPALAASYQVAEMLKVIINRGDLLRNKLLYIDTLSNTSTIIEL